MKIALVLVVLGSVSANAEEIKCNTVGSQLEMNVCAKDDFDKADKELNKIYMAVIKKEEDDSLFVEKLRVSQKKWLVFRGADVEAFFACSDEDKKICFGSMYPMSLNSYKADLTRIRTNQLKRILKNGRG